MPRRNNILAFIAAIVVSAQTLPPNIGQGSFVYDPDSIPQNEKILRLFLCLASHTANRLIYLKNMAKLQQTSTPHVEETVPAVRIELPHDHPSRRMGGSGNNYGQTTRYPGQYQGPYMPGPVDKVVSPEYKRPTGRRINDQNFVESAKSNANRSLKDTTVLPQASNNSTGANVSLIESQDKSKELSQGIGSENSTNTPVEIANRMLFKVEKNNYVTQYTDNSKNINNADTKINNIALANQQGVPQSGSVVVKQNAGSSGLHGYNINQTKTEGKNVGSGSSGAVVVAQNAASMISSQNTQNSGSSIEGIKSVASSVETKSSGNTQQSNSADSHLQSLTSGVGSSAQGMKSVISNAGGSGISRQTTSAFSNLQSGMKNAAQGLATGLQNASASAGISSQANTATSKLHSMTSGIISSAQGAASDAQRTVPGEEMSRQALTGAAHVQSGVTEQLSGVQQAGSKVLMGTMNIASNQASQTTTTLAADQRHESSGNHGLIGFLDQNKSGGVLSNANTKTSALMDKGSSLGSHAVSISTGVGNNATGKVTQTIQSTGAKVVQGIEKPVSSLQGSSDKIGKLLGGLNSAGSKITGSLVVEGTKGSKTAFESSIQRGRASSSLMKSGSDGVSQVGSSLIASVPLFRSFPNVYDESSILKKFVLDTTQPKKNQTQVINGQTSFNQQNGDNQAILTAVNSTTRGLQNQQSTNTSTKIRPSESYDELGINDDGSSDSFSELNMADYANQFADALRPVESIRRPSR